MLMGGNSNPKTAKGKEEGLNPSFSLNSINRVLLFIGP